MNLSVIIPAYNNLPDVLRCLHSLEQLKALPDTELLIQDDASPEYDGPDLFGPMCQRNPANLGFNRNCFEGASRAKGDVLMFLNQDTKALTQNWDEILIRAFESNPIMGIVGPTLLFPDGRIQSVGGLWDAKSQPYHDSLGFNNPDWITVSRRVSWVTGAALAIRRNLWVHLGGFDPTYIRSYFEDADLCIRATLAGAEIWHLPSIRFQHRVGSTGGSIHFQENARLFRQKWVDSGIIKPDIQAVRERFW